ncbi:MAG: hypothetical protein MNPFHGCM_00352 [Gemmatimonadaceae bacterium]|nr:hypothetical protein [Gemmatimonadaceae bacterium]
MHATTERSTDSPTRAHVGGRSSAAEFESRRVLIVSTVRLLREGLAELVERGGWCHAIVRVQTLDDIETSAASEPAIALIDASDAQAVETVQRLSRFPVRRDGDANVSALAYLTIAKRCAAIEPLCL